jgi:hypothetical protein
MYFGTTSYRTWPATLSDIDRSLYANAVRSRDISGDTGVMHGPHPHTVKSYFFVDPDVQVDGTRWPSESDGDNTRLWVETDDEARIYETDEEAQEVIIAALKAAGVDHMWTWGEDDSPGRPTPYIDPINNTKSKD